MLRKFLIATVAAAPLLGPSAWAQTEVTSSTRTTPIATSTAAAGAADDVKITVDGAITPTTSGAIVTLDSDNIVTNNGSLLASNLSDSVGILVLGGHAGSVLNSASIQLIEDYAPTDTDADGVVDGPFAQGSNRYGVRLTGAGAFTGDIVSDAAGSIIVEGDNSRGLSIESPLNGNLTSLGSVSVTGDNAVGVLVTAPVSGNVTLGGSVSVLGKSGVGVAIDADVAGALAVQGAISATGYRYAGRPDEATIALLGADDLLQGGPGLRIAGDVAGGVLLNGPTTSSVVDLTTLITTTTTLTSAETGTASISVYGGAPALLIGSDTRAVTIGAVGAADNAYGLIIKGGVTASGVYDDIAATGLQIGGAGGQATILVGGARLDGSVSANARDANSTAINLTAGAVVPSLWNLGSISSSSSSYADSTLSADARALVVNAGASLSDLTNAGAIVATRNGVNGDAIAVLDTSGTLKTLTNRGSIMAQVTGPTTNLDGTTVTTTPVPTGAAIALDLRASTGGVTVTQTYPVSASLTSTFPSTDTITSTPVDTTTSTPSIIGAVMFGSGDDTLDVQGGYVLGALSFGAGADKLIVDGGSTVIGALTDSDGRLDITVDTGTLALTNAATIKATSLTLGAAGKLVFAVDPDAGTATKLSVGAANIATGANIGLTFNNLLTQKSTFTVIEAQSLTAGTIHQDLLGEAPYLYVAQAYSDAQNVYVDVRRRTAAEANLSRAEASAYDAVFSALSANDAIAGAFLAQNTRDGFLNLYDQMLPGQGEGMFAALQSINQQTSAATALKPDGAQRYGPDSIWVQEINTLVRRDAGDTQASDTEALGFIAGYEAMGEAGGALGLTLAVVSIDEKDYAAKVGENTNTSLVQTGAYWRRSAGGWRFNLGATAGYGWFSGERRFISEDVNSDGIADVVVANSADWTGLTASAFAGLGYEAKLGRFYARPEARLDYVWLKEGGRTETGGGDGFDLIIDGRQSSRLSGEVAVAVGATFGRELWWRPEVRVGYRQGLAGEIGDTVAHFAGGTPFTLVASPEADAVTLGLALRAGTAMSYVALEGGVDASRRQKNYRLKMTGRAMF
ncbi:MAG: Autotransporter beta-domain protein [Caulobacter sp.]|nr:Autotransporter beta-domain protein [Caulobacter sp.]